MRYFYVTDEQSLTLLGSFIFREGQSTLVRTPTLSGDIFQRGRAEPHTFTMDATGLGQQLGEFKVVDENFTVYECIGTNCGGERSGISISGIVTDRWQIEETNRAKALKMMREAIGA